MLDIIELEQATLSILREGACSEFELIKKLQTAPYAIISDAVFKNDLALFQTHFITYHVLYKLQAFGLETQSFYLDILPTQIQLLPYSQQNTTQLNSDNSEHKLREYYLDLRHLDNTGQEDIEALLSSFWQKFVFTTDLQQINDALTMFNYDALPDLATLKRDYKMLSLKHHPDKGGDAVSFQKLHGSYRVLSKHLNDL